MYLHVTFSRERERKRGREREKREKERETERERERERERKGEREGERERAPHHYYEKSVKLFKLSLSVPSFLSLSFSYRFFDVHTKADEKLLLL